jgi:hypothetical protein
MEWARTPGEEGTHARKGGHTCLGRARTYGAGAHAWEKRGARLKGGGHTCLGKHTCLGMAHTHGAGAHA